MLNGVLITGVASPVYTQMNHHDNLNVFCMYAGHTGIFDSEHKGSLDDLKHQLEIPENCLKLGPHTVLVTNVTEFFNRVRKSVENENYSSVQKLVDYYNPETFSGGVSEEDAVFKKRDEFQHQKEYRFSFDTGTSGENAITMEIVDIRDIAILVETNKANSIMELKPK